MDCFPENNNKTQTEVAINDIKGLLLISTVLQFHLYTQFVKV